MPGIANPILPGEGCRRAPRVVARSPKLVEPQRRARRSRRPVRRGQRRRGRRRPSSPRPRAAARARPTDASFSSKVTTVKRYSPSLAWEAPTSRRANRVAGGQVRGTIRPRSYDAASTSSASSVKSSVLLDLLLLRRRRPAATSSCCDLAVTHAGLAHLGGQSSWVLGFWGSDTAGDDRALGCVSVSVRCG